MYLNDFNQTSKQKITKINKLLKEEFAISLSKKLPSKKKLEKVLENTLNTLTSIRVNSNQYHTNPEYSKYIGLKDALNIMLNEGVYAESPQYNRMKTMISDSISQLMDSGYTMDEAAAECMNRYRMDNRFAYDDEHVLPIVLTAAKDYMENCGMNAEGLGDGIDETVTDLTDALLGEMARECGVELAQQGSIDAIEEKLQSFAEVSGKSRDSVVGFLNNLEEADLVNGIQMFGKKIGAVNRMRATEITENVDVTAAELVMAVRALADDIQDQIERVGRMMNEDVPAIADQMRTEQGAQAAQAFSDSVHSTLNAYIEAGKAAKAGMDQATATVSGEAPAMDDMGLGDTGELDGLGGAEDDLGLDDVDVNEPAMAGPEDEPLGRAPVEI